MIAQRMAALRARMRELELDGFLVTGAENRRYISGFTGSAGVCVVTQSAAKLVADFRYFEQVKAQAKEYELVEMTGKFEDLLTGLVGDLGVRRLGFEAENVSYNAYEAYSKALPEGVSLVPTTDVVRWLRAEKYPDEIEAIKKAIALTDRAMDTVRAIIRPGMTEREVAWKFEEAMRTAGAEKLSFDVICAGGPASAMAHARPTDREIRAGEPIVLDTGCVVEGYCSDLTRTLIIGEPDAKFRQIYEIVLRAQEAAEAGIRVGMTGREAHAIAADIIGAADYGAQFGHGLGHGVGLAIHELPALSPASEHALKAGQVFSVEPGIYLPEWGGVRIEDLALLRSDGLEVLTQTSKDPVIPLR